MSLIYDAVSQMNDVQFVWDKRGDRWSREFKQLADYIAKHGHNKVPSTDKSLQPLC